MAIQQQQVPPRRYGLRLWPPGAPFSTRFVRVLFLGFVLVCAAAVSAPFLFPWAGPYPIVFGFPFSFFWMIAWLFIMYAGLFAYDRMRSL